MPILAALSFAIQLLFVIHAYRSGAPRYWIFVILLFPVAGSLAYYLFEVFPSSREARAVRRTSRQIARSLDPDRELRARVDEVSLCGSIDNRIALAEECLACGIPAEAIRLYESCREGPYAEDSVIAYGLARACVEGGRYSQAVELVESLSRSDPKFRTQELALLYARSLEGQGNHDGAATAYRELLPVFNGLEARCRYGMLLERLGRAAEARATFSAAVVHARRSPPAHEAERRWADVARRRMETS